ncbi:MAG TPA: hypothetical protein VKB43_08640 [Gaiellaceae bacterium]|nr:hypothetical protein [Gaiellaceae bacterium]
MRHFHGVKAIALVTVVSALAASAWTVAAPAAPRSTQKTVAGTVSCTTEQGSMQISAFAYRPDPFDYAAATIYTGPPNTPATIPLVQVETDKSNYALDDGCSQTKKSVRFTHRGLTSAGVVKAGYYQSLTAYCGAPSRIIVRYRFGFGTSGKPATATIAVWAKRKKSSKLHEIGYVQWSRNRSITYYSRKSCVGQY